MSAKPQGNQGFKNDLNSRLAQHPPGQKRTREEGYAPDGTPLVSRRIFDKYDKKHLNAVDAQDFYDICYDCGYSLSDAELEVALAQIDRDGNGKLSYKEFANFWKNDDRFSYLINKDPAQSEWLQQAIRYYRYFDEDRNGTLSPTEFARVYSDLQRFGATPKSLENTIADLDDGQGSISFNQFVEWQKKLNRVPQSSAPQRVQVMPSGTREISADESSSSAGSKPEDTQEAPKQEGAKQEEAGAKQEDQVKHEEVQKQPEETKKRVSLRNHHGKYLSVDNDGNVRGSADAVAEGEKWIMEEDKEYKKTSFKNEKKDKFMCCERDGGKMVANRDGVGAWEHFDVDRVGGEDSNKFTIKGHLGKFVCGEPDGKIVGNRDRAAEWEQFEIIKL